MYGKCRKGAYGIVPIYRRRKGMKERKPSGCRKEDLINEKIFCRTCRVRVDSVHIRRMRYDRRVV